MNTVGLSTVVGSSSSDATATVDAGPNQERTSQSMRQPARGGGRHSDCRTGGPSENVPE